MDEAIRLSYYKNSLRTAWGYNDYNDWPIKLNSVMHLFLKEFAVEFLSDLSELREKKVHTKEIAKAFGTTARFYRMIDPVIFGMKRLKMNLSEQRKVVLGLLDIVKEMKYGSEFNEDGANMVLSPEDVASLLGKINFHNADDQQALLIQRFCGVMWAYTESILFRAHEVTKEVHGPYVVDENGDKLLVREYHHLSPVEIWGDIPFMAYKDIVIYTIYNKNLDVNIDSYNHLFLNGGNYAKDLVSFAIEANGEPIQLEKLLSVMPLMQKTMQAVHAWVNQAGWHDKVNRYADIFWYRKSPLRTLLGKDWRVPETVRRNILNGKADTKRLEKLSDEAIDRLIQIVI